MKQLKESILDRDFDVPDLLIDLDQFSTLNNRAAFEDFEHICRRFNMSNYLYNFFYNLKREQDALLKAADDCFSDEEQKNDYLKGLGYKFNFGSLAWSSSVKQLQSDLNKQKEPNPKKGIYLNKVLKFVKKLDDFLDKQVHGYSKMEICADSFDGLIPDPTRPSRKRPLVLVFRKPVGQSSKDIMNLGGKTIEGYQIVWVNDSDELENERPVSWGHDDCAMIQIRP